MPFGSLFGSLFFVLLALAAWSSAISLIEPAVAWLVETGKFNRITATIGYSRLVGRFRHRIFIYLIFGAMLNPYLCFQSFKTKPYLI